jgi:hypothetical protein
MSRGVELNWAEIEAQIVPMLRAGKCVREVCAATGIKIGTLYPRIARIRARHGLPTPQRAPQQRPGETLPPSQTLSERAQYGVEPLPANCKLAKQILEEARAR